MVVVPLIAIVLFGICHCAGQQVRRHGANYLSGQWSPSLYNSSTSMASLQALYQGAGITWIALTYCHFQHSVDSTGPIFPGPRTPTADELGSIVQKAHAMGVKVMFRPCIDPDWSNPQTNGTWRGEIGRNFTAQQWVEWFSNYEPFIVGQAKLAHSFAADVFSIGMEYVIPSAQTSFWEAVAKAVRAVFPGPITYCANHGNEGNIGFWSSVDEISIDAYYTLAPSSKDPSLDDIKAAWQPIVLGLSQLSSKVGKRVNFAEIGYCSVVGANIFPADAPCADPLIVDLELQARLYSAFYEVVYNQPWFLGVFWWAWTTDVLPSGPKDPSFSPRGKPAEQVMLTNSFPR